MDFFFAAILLLLAIGGVVIRKTYYYLPARELKRQAEQQDQTAVQLYRAVAYGSSLRGFMWLFIALTSAGGFILLARSVSTWLSLLIVSVIIWAAFLWLPGSRVTKFGAKLTELITPALAKLLSYLHPVLHRTAGVAEKRYSIMPHTGMFERDDLIKLIEQQQLQSDSRLTTEELEIAKRALSFDDHKVADIVTPRKKIKTVLAGETLGPILIDEVHKSGQTFALVREKKQGPVIGALTAGQLGINSTGKVSDVMINSVYYLHENDGLGEALHAFFVTNHPLFVVVNSFEEYVGVVTIENVLKQLLGHVPGDDFDQYANLAAVAARHSKPKPVPEDSVKTDEEVVE